MDKREYELGALSTGLSELKEQVRLGFDTLGQSLKSHSTRIESVERWRAYITGAIAVLAFIVTVLVSVSKGLMAVFGGP